MAAAGPDLRARIEAATETGCRKGERLSLQWRQVRFTPRPEIVLPAHKTKTKRERTVPMSSRLKAILQMRQRWTMQRVVLCCAALHSNSHVFAIP